MLVLSATHGEVAPLEAALGGAVAEAAPEREGPATWWGRRRASCGATEVVFATSGVGKVNAAAATALALSSLRPRCLVLVGIGGAYPGAGLDLGEVALAASETQVDSGVGHGAGWQGLDAIGFPLLTTDPPSFNRLWFDQRFVGRLAKELGVKALPFATSDAITATAADAAWLERRHGVAVESMEGGAVAQVALAFGVPLVQLRGVSNVVGERDKARWDVRSAVANACAVASRAIPLLAAA